MMCVLMFIMVSVVEVFEIDAIRALDGSFQGFASNIGLGVPAQLTRISAHIAGAESSARGYVITSVHNTSAQHATTRHQSAQ